VLLQGVSTDAGDYSSEYWELCLDPSSSYCTSPPPPILRSITNNCNRGIMPRALFAGVFLVVGWGSIESNPIIHKTLFLLRDSHLIPLDHPLVGLKKLSIAKFLAIQWAFYAAIIAISETIGQYFRIPSSSLSE
jgi:hypothetical protein